MLGSLLMGGIYMGSPISFSAMSPATSPQKIWLLLFTLFIVCINMSGLVLGGCLTMKMGGILLASFILWGVTLVLLSYKGGLTGLVSHFLPVGLGGGFVYLMPVLELFSWLVRPLTLGVRLGVNISSGHVLMLMLVFFSGQFNFFVVIAVGLVSILEVVVCYLQGYIYVSLLVLYSS
uniref:ATP synthase subunit a n=1 Tax=Hebesoma violentum TaxID=1410563 RepID=A0A0C4JQE8_9BILA|nr:ATP synthase F0 subunit 6 [Hebesoma violentum]